MQNTIAPIEFPELIFAIAGPIGIDAEAIQASLVSALQEVGYGSVPIKLSAEMEKVPLKFRFLGYREALLHSGSEGIQVMSSW